MKFAALKRMTLSAQRALYARLPFVSEKMDDKQALTVMESCRPNMTKLPSPSTMRPTTLDLSILIPAYNVAPFVEQCLQSVIHQTTSYSYEIIVVDDGSTDGTSAILDRYAGHGGSTVLHQSNKGLACTRNRLLNEASGEYIMFVDADDVLPPNAIEALMRNTGNQKIDIVQGSYQNIRESGERISAEVSHFRGTCGTYAERIRHLSGVCWGKVIRRSLFRCARFVENIVFEDTLLHFVIYELCRSSIIIPDEVYQYRIVDNSITHTLNVDYKGIDTIYQVDALLKLRDEIGLPMNDDLYRMMLFQCGPILFNRVRGYNTNILRAAFIHCAHTINNLARDTDLDSNQQYLQQAFQTFNYKLWKSASRVQ